jgi:hypothetical protein
VQDKYLDFMCSVLDKCAECQGLPMSQLFGAAKEFTVECDMCGQMVGPFDSKGLAMAEWNKEQRRIVDDS